VEYLPVFVNIVGSIKLSAKSMFDEFGEVVVVNIFLKVCFFRLR